MCVHAMPRRGSILVCAHSENSRFSSESRAWRCEQRREPQEGVNSIFERATRLILYVCARAHAPVAEPPLRLGGLPVGERLENSRCE